jgi:hypothetical protein
MPPPPSYFDIAAVPFSHTFAQADFNAGTYGGTVNQVWLRRITTAKVALGIFTDKGGTFTPDTTIYQSDGTTVVKAETSASNVSMFAIVPIGTYYIKIVRHGGGSSDFDFTTQVNEKPTDGDVLPLTIGQYIINDDTTGFPATVLNSDGTIAGFLTTIPAGETGAFLSTGESLWHDRFGMVGPANRMALFDADLTYVMSINLSLGAPLPIVTHSDTDFYVLDRSGGEVWKITSAGVSTDLGFVTFSQRPSAAAASADGTILYWLEEDGNAGIHRYQLVSMMALSDLNTITGFDTGADSLALTPNVHPGDLLILSDGTFVTWYQDISAGDWKLIHLDVDGSVLDAFSFAVAGGIDHLFPAADALHVGIWLFTTAGLDEGRIGIVDLSDGSVADDFTTTLFNSGKNLQTDDATLFAPSASCTIFAIGVLTGGGGGGGGGSPLPEEGGIIGPLLWIHWPRTVPT